MAFDTQETSKEFRKIQSAPIAIFVGFNFIGKQLYYACHFGRIFLAERSSSCHQNTLHFIWLFLSLFLWTIPCQLHAQTGAKVDSPSVTPPDKVVIVIGDLKITARDTEKMLENFPPAQRSFYSGSGKRQLAEYILNSKFLTKEAEKRHLDESEDVKIRLNLARDSILMYAARQELQKEMTATTEEAQKFLDDNITKYEEARVRRIVTPGAL